MADEMKVHKMTAYAIVSPATFVKTHKLTAYVIINRNTAEQPAQRARSFFVVPLGD